MSSAPEPDAPDVLLRVEGVSKIFARRVGLVERLAGGLGARVDLRSVRAVSDVSFSLTRGEVVALVGESGCGKSTLGRMVAGLVEPTEGRIRYRGIDPARSDSRQARREALRVQMIFQDPFASLNPRLRICDIIGEAPRVHGLAPRSEIPALVDDVMRRCGLDPALRERYPHQFSGGQRQRVGIARALAVAPEFIVADEAVASLDVSIQAQILNLFMQLRRELSLSWLFISHSIAVVRHISDRILVMYLGRIVEDGPTEEVFARPLHPYTEALLKEAPRIEDRRASFRPIQGEIPSPLDPPSGCHFHPRCPLAQERCRVEAPLLRAIAPRRTVACHLAEAR